ncbi:ribokinase [Alkalihalophilus marmarensis]|uniref:Ribokinase n=1 Tax=Alkalihalophilus marmarensis DSM 21297 TaxID=1188261 RepID=U6SMI6_9BACI|nr:ribokinase [Alkalihalophilus marmarensis]ERN51821.1 hypothetical protein A33I_18595 [Alkalihalophilus marmarensis DSM 21297]
MLKRRPNIAVVGSINVDLVMVTSRIPEIGETVIGTDFRQLFGGKGANQAISAARLGGNVSFIGCIGDDDYGLRAKKVLMDEGIQVEGIQMTQKAPTGTAQITRWNNENSIIVNPGANAELTTEWVLENRNIIESADIVLTQLEIPKEVVQTVVDIAYSNQIPVILNPAPAQYLSDELLKKVTYLTPNESELNVLADSADSTIEAKFNLIRRKGVRTLIVTQGSKGVTFNIGSDLHYKEAVTVEALDSTGAGDSFNGAFAVAISQKSSINEAVAYAVKASGISVTRLGAQDGMPYQHELV